jgi:hypothetical protein
MTADLAQRPAARAPKNSWGSANAKRGVVKDENPQKYFELAARFAAQHPVGSSLAMQEFDAFLANEEMMAPPPSPSPPAASKEWLGHLQDRKRHREGLSRAARHPRIRDYQTEPFELIWPRGGTGKHIQVVSLAKAVIHKPQELIALLEGWSTRLKHTLQGFDQFALSPEQLALVETCYEALNNVVEDSTRDLERAYRTTNRTLALLSPPAVALPPPPDEDDS